jgi:biopolymer transport protein ExbD
MNFRTRKRREPQLVVVSLIDVVLQLVIFLLLTTTFRAGGTAMDVSLPEVEDLAAALPAALVLDLDRDGKVSVEGEEVGLEKLAEALRRTAVNTEARGVVIRADRRVSHGEVVELMDLARKHDIRRLAVAAVLKETTP